MVRRCVAVGGNARQIDISEIRKQFNETKAEVAQELNKLIDKIGIVNVVALLYALNDADITDIDSNFTNDFTTHGWFNLDNCYGEAINVDDELYWRQRWCVIEQIHFGYKDFD